MIMKNGKRIRFIYKNGKRIDKIIRHGKVYFEQGFVKEQTSTTLPINFDGIGKDLKDYKIYGNTYQKTTDGKNLIPNNKISRTNQGVTFTPQEDGTYLINGQNTTNSNAIVYIYQGDFNLQAGTYYGIPTGDNNITVTMYARYSDNTVQYIDLKEINNINKQIIYAYIYIQVRKNTSTIFNDYKVYPMLSAMPITIDDYEPYTNGASPNPIFPSQIVSCGDIKNLFNWTTMYSSGRGIALTTKEKTDLSIVGTTSNTYFQMTITKNNIIKKDNWTYSFSFTAPLIKLDKTTNHTLTLQNIEFVSAKPAITIFTGDNEYYNMNYDNNNNAFVEIPAGKDIYAVAFRFLPKTTYTLIGKFQLEKGPDTEYEPYGYKIPINVNGNITNIYLDEPLRKSNDGTYKDYIDFKNKKIYRQIKETVLTGNENWDRVGANNNGNRFKTPISDLAIGAEKILYCTHFKNDGDTWSHQGTSGSLGTMLYIRWDELFETVEDLKTWLASNTPIVDYVLATPTEESITLPNIPTVDGNNTLNIETEITPSQVYIKYRNDN